MCGNRKIKGSEARVEPPTLMANTIANRARNRLAILLPRLTVSSAAARRRACATPKRFRAANILAEASIPGYENTREQRRFIVGASQHPCFSTNLTYLRSYPAIH